MGTARRLIVKERIVERGPVRARRIREHDSPYRREEETRRDREDGLLDRVRNVLRWLLPGWWSPKEDIDGCNAEMRRPKEPEEKFAVVPEEHPMMIDILATAEQAREDSNAIFRRLLVDKTRQDIYSDLARFFRSKGNILLTREEYEELSIMIQRQAPISRLRRVIGSTMPEISKVGDNPMVVPYSSPGSLSMPSKAKEMDTPKLSEDTILPPPKTSPPPQVARRKTKSRIYSARFDEELEEGEREREEKGEEEDRLLRNVVAGKVISENRRKLIDEARKRVAEQIKLVQIRTEPSGAEEPLVQLNAKEVPERTKMEEDKKEQTTVFPKFEFTIPATSRDQSQAPPPAAPVPKLIFDFDSTDTTTMGEFQARSKNPPSLFAIPEEGSEGGGSVAKKPATNDVALGSKSISPAAFVGEDKEGESGMVKRPSTDRSDTKSPLLFSFNVKGKLETSDQPKGLVFGDNSGEKKPLAFDFANRTSAAPATTVVDAKPNTAFSSNAPSTLGLHPSGSITPFNFGALSATDITKDKTFKPVAPVSNGFNVVSATSTMEAKPSTILSTVPSTTTNEPKTVSSMFSFGGVPSTATITPGFGGSTTPSVAAETRPFDFGFKVTTGAPAVPAGSSTNIQAPFGLGGSQPASSSMFAFNQSAESKPGFSFGSTITANPPSADNEMNAEPSLPGLSFGLSNPPVSTNTNTIPTNLAPQFQFGATPQFTFGSSAQVNQPSVPFAFGQVGSATASTVPTSSTAPTMTSTTTTSRKFSVPTTRRRK